MTTRIPSLSGHACWLLLGLLMLGCGRAAESAPKSGAEPTAPGEALAASREPEPATLAEAEELLARAQAELDQQLALNQPPSAAGAPAPAPASAAAPEAERAQRAEKAPADDAASSTAPAPPPPNPCETACRAFASLGRASDAVCRLDSEGGQRCERARQIKNDAARRVASCGCQ